MNPRDVLRLLLRHVGNGNWTQLPSLYAPDAIVEHPLVRDESRRMAGRDAVAEMFLGYGDSGIRLSPRDVTFYDVTDSDLVIADFVYDAVTTDGRRAALSACFIWRVRDGLITHARDYLEPLPRR